MKCGACKEVGPEITVDHVRKCYQTTDRVEVPGLHGVFVPANGGVRVPTADAIDDMHDREPSLPSRPQPSAVTEGPWAVVNSLQDQIKPFLKHKHGPAMYGRFAAHVWTEDKAQVVVKFYRVKLVVGGRYNGRVFVDAQASDEYWAVRTPAALQMILAAILVDPDKAAKLYADELGQCYMCGRTLTDETSRSIGMGPDCRSK